MCVGGERQRLNSIPPPCAQVAKVFLMCRVTPKSLAATPGMLLQVRPEARDTRLLPCDAAPRPLVPGAQADFQAYTAWLTVREAQLYGAIAAAAPQGSATAASATAKAASLAGAIPASATPLPATLESAAATSQLQHVQVIRGSQQAAEAAAVRTHSLPPPPLLQRAMRECNAPDAALLGSNVLSSAEAVLLRWLSHHHHRVNGPADPRAPGRRFVNFDADLADGSAFLAALLSHVPDLALPGHALDPDAAAAAGTPFHLPHFTPAHLRKAGGAPGAAVAPGASSSSSSSSSSSAPLSRRQCTENVRAVFAALRELQLDPPFDAADLAALQVSVADVSAAAAVAVAASSGESARPTDEAVPSTPSPQKGPPGFISGAAAAELLAAGSPPPPVAAPYDIPGSGAPLSSAPVTAGSAAGPVPTAPGAAWERVGGGPLRCGGVLVALWFFTVLPQLVPRACLDLRGPLAQTTTRNVTLVNPSKKVRSRMGGSDCSFTAVLLLSSSFLLRCPPRPSRTRCPSRARPSSPCRSAPCASSRRRGGGGEAAAAAAAAARRQRRKIRVCVPWRYTLPSPPAIAVICDLCHHVRPQGVRPSPRKGRLQEPPRGHGDARDARLRAALPRDVAPARGRRHARDRCTLLLVGRDRGGAAQRH